MAHNTLNIKKTTRFTLLTTSLLLTLASTANASIIVTYAEAPTQETTSLTDTNVYTFNNLTAGQKYTNLAWTDGSGNTIGTFNSLYVNAADQYGGAVDASHPNGSNYAVESASVGGSNHVEVSTLTLSTASAYFGFWWSAGDANNEVDFYNGTTLEAAFTTASLMSTLPKTYDGNPRSPSTLDPNEPFAFINFYAMNGITFNKIVFTDTQSSGFEADNYTVRTQAWGSVAGESGSTPGNFLESVTGSNVSTAAVPEPGTTLLLLVGMAAIGGVRRMKQTAQNSGLVAA